MSYITIIGVGKVGIGVVNQMVNKGMSNDEVSFLVCDTEEVVLHKHLTENRTLISYKTGSERFLSVEAQTKFKSRLEDVRIVFLVAAMGDRAESDILPELVNYCHDLGIKVFCLVSSPSTCEGEVIGKIAENSIMAIRKCADNVVVVNNDFILEPDNNIIPVNEFRKSSQALAELCNELYRLLCAPKYISLDTEDIYRFFDNSAITIIASGYSNDSNRIISGFDNALESPAFTSHKIGDIDKIICEFQCSSQHQLGTDDVECIHEIMKQRINEKTSFIWHASFNEELNEKIKVIIFANINKH
jgi:cell division protein FtsZ